MRIFTSILFMMLIYSVNGFSQNACDVTISGGNGFSLDGTTVCQGETIYLSAASNDVGIPAGTTFSWSNGGSNYFTTITPNGTSNYSVVVQYPNGCVAMDQITVNVSAPPAVSVSNVSNATCNTANGSASVTANGAGGYSYAWSNGSTGSTISGVSAGSYTVTVTDQNGCKSIANAAVGVVGATGISGLVYGDYNYNAANDQVFQAYQNVTVELYGADANGNSVLVATTTTNGNGLYSFNPSFANGESYRVQFQVPAQYEVTTNGNIDNTEVRFINGPACDVDLAISVPSDYCHTDDPIVVVPCWINGDANATGPNTDAIVSTNYKNEGFPGEPGYTSPNIDAMANQVGSLYGVAYQRFDKVAFFSSYAKRHVGFGPQGIAGIYSIDYSSGTAGPVTPYLDLSAFVPFGNVTGRDLPLTSVASPSYDVDAFGKVGKAGIGDIDISDDGSTMYVVNMFNQTLVQVGIGNPVGAPAFQGIIPIPNPCGSPEWRPFGLKFYAGKLYVGGVCSGEVTGAQPTGYIYEYDPAVGFNTTPILTIPFNYSRDGAFGCGRAVGDVGDFWYPWSDVYQGPAYPQPMLSDIEFEVDGSIIIGVRDRNADQLGFQNYLPDPAMADQTLTSGLAIGDMLKATNNGNGTYTLENNGTAQGVTTAGAGNGQGPGGGEFFVGDLKLCHNEASTGALAKYAGSGEVLSTVYDPHRAYSQGFSRFSNVDGTGFEGYEVFQEDVNNPLGFGKANGLGDIEIFCDPAPIEIGDFVWIDANKNGIQDPGETPIPGVQINLYDEFGNFVSTTTTDGDGYYYFYNVDFNTDYFVTVEGYGANGLPVNGNDLELTVDNQGGNNEIDSDGVINVVGVPGSVIGKPAIAVTTGLPGETDHSLDFGFFGCSISVDAGIDARVCRGTVLTLTASATNAVNPQFTWSTGQSGASIQLTFTQTQTYTVDVVDDFGCVGQDEVTVTVENAPLLDIQGPIFLCATESGMFSIPNPDANANYSWDVDGGTITSGNASSTAIGVSWPAAFSGQTVTVRLTATSGDLSCESTDEYQLNIGGNVSANAGQDQGGCSNLAQGVTIGGSAAFVAPQGGTINWSPATHLSSTTIPNPQVNLPAGVNSFTYTVTVTKDGCEATDQVTVFRECVSIGSTVFSDNNNNGVQDGNELTIGQKGKSVLMELYDASTGALVATTATDANGSYIFQDLSPGDYFIEFTPPSSLPVSSTPTDNNDNRQDGDDNGSQGDSNNDGITDGVISSPVINLTPGQEPANETGPNGNKDAGEDTNGDMTVDFGLVPLMSIGSTVFSDDNNNGQQDAGEETLGEKGKSVTLELYDANTGALVATTMTDTDGSYIFQNLLPGDYYIEFMPPASISVSSTPTDNADNQQDGDDNGTQADTNGDGVTDGVITSPVISLVGGDEPTNEPGSNGNKDVGNDENGDMTVDFGLVPLMSIGSTVFSDDNNNGVQDANEDNLGEKGKSVTLELYDANTGALVATTMTDGNGSYIFQNLLPGDYFVEFTPPTSLPVSSGPTDTNDNQQDGDDNGIQNDTNGDGITDGTIRSPIINLSAGDEPTNEPNDNGNKDAANDDNGDMTIDFGLIPLLSLGSTVFSDDNNNGQQDPGEDTLGAKGKSVTLELYDANSGALVATTSTDTDGSYIFQGLLPGDYFIEFTPPASLPVSSGPTDTNDNDQDGDDNGIQNDTNGDGITDGVIMSPVIELTAGGEPTNEPGTHGNKDAADDDNGNMTIDFGLVPLMSVGSTVFSDDNNNGIQDPGEDTLGAKGKSVTLELYDAATGALVATTMTDSDGSYVFNNLPPGDYYIEFTPPASLPSSSSNTDTADNDQDGDDNGSQNDTNGDGITDGLITSNTFTLSPGDEPTNEPGTHGNKDAGADDNGNMTIDFGIVPIIDLNLRKVVNGPTSVDIGDVVTFNIIVENDGPSDATGVEVTDVFPNGYTAVAAAGASVAGNTVTWSGISLTVGQSMTLTATATVIAPGAGVNYVNIAEITDADQQDVDSTPGNGADTDGDGNIGSEDNDGNQDPDDDDDGDDAEVEVIEPLMSVGSTIFSDDNNNGVQDAGEQTLGAKGKSVTLELYDAATGALVATTPTDTDGSYVFNNLPSGNYYIEFMPPSSLPVSSDNTDTNDNDQDGDDNGSQTDSNGDGFTDGRITSNTFNLTPGAEPTNEPGTHGNKDAGDDENGNMTIDFGLVPVIDLDLIKVVNGPTTVITGDVVTFNILVENNGPSDATGVEVTDVFPNGYTAVAAAGASVAGNTVTWSGISLSVGQTMTLTASATVVAPGAGVSYVNIAEITDADQDDLDSDPGNGADTDGDGNIGSEDNDGNQDPDDEDDGDDAEVTVEDPLMSVGSTIFVDTDDDGVQDPGEPTIGSLGKIITLELYDAATGALVATTMTDTDGSYVFNNLPEGNYFIEFTPPSSFPVSSSTTNTSDDGVDGDDNGSQTDSNGDGFTDGAITSPTFNLTAGAEPTNEPGTHGNKDAADDGNGDMTIDFGLVPVIDLKLIKVPSVMAAVEVQPGDVVSFDIVVTNDGPSDATGVEVTDVFPNGYTAVSAAGGSVAGNTVTWTGINLIVGQSITLTASGTVVAPGAGISYVNVAEITDADQDDIDSTPGNGADTDGDGDIGSEDPDGSQDPDDEDDGDDAEVIVGCDDVTGEAFVDNNGDGCKDTDDAPIPNLTVTLLDCAGSPIVDGAGDVITTTTNSEGVYTFEDACVYGSEFVIEFGNPGGGLLPTAKNTNGCGDINSEINPDGTSDCTPNTPDGPDAGFTPSMSVGSTIFSDDNDNGVQDPGEPTIGSSGKIITLDLYDAVTGALVATTMTDSDGSYVFTNLPEGDYYIEFTPPTSFPVSSTTTSTFDDGVDGDDNGSQGDSNGDGITDGVISSPTFNLTAGSEPTNEPETHGNKDAGADSNGDMTIDFGLIPTPTGDFDLALTKVVTPGQGSVFIKGQSITYTIAVMNQGAVTADNIQVRDYAPACFTLNDVNWSASGSDFVRVLSAGSGLPAGGLAPGAMVTADITFIIGQDCNGGSQVNVAEIESATDGAGNQVTDIDSTPDSNPNNDAGGNPGTGSDDATGGNGTGNPGDTSGATDEDDSDPAEITIDSPLAVELVTFTGKYMADSDAIKVDWLVQNEVNADYYELERSANGSSDFVEIATKDAYGLVNGQTDYEHLDNNLGRVDLYLYRLKMFDGNGDFEYSDIISIELNKIDLPTTVDVYPNPAKDLININVNSKSNSKITVEMFDIKGKQFGNYSVSETSTSGNEKLQLNLTGLPAGTYVVRARVNDEVFVKRLTIVD